MGNFKALQQGMIKETKEFVGKMCNLQNGQLVVDKSITNYYNTSKWNSKSADYILLLLQRNTNEILDVSNQNVDDEGLILIHFFLVLNKKLKAKVK